jgi:hypothetical protein
LAPASALQLTLNFFECRCIRSSDGDLASENHVQHVKECVRWNVRQLCQHGQPPEANLMIAISTGNPAARFEQSEGVMKTREINGTAPSNAGFV